MKRFGQIKAYVGGMLTVIALIAMSVPVWGLSTKTLSNVMVGGIKIVVDGQQINPTDANGNTVDPMIYNGTTYLPVRAVASALGKEVYWDGPNYTVYLGAMGGNLRNASVMLKDMESIGTYKPDTANSSELIDNYGNTYSSALSDTMGSDGDACWEYLLNMKYSRFKGTLYIPKGTTFNESWNMIVTADGQEIYASPLMTKTSQPVSFDINVTGYNDLKIHIAGYHNLCLAEAGFYQ